MPGPCPKCGGAMEEGFLLSRNEHGNGAQKWVSGEPQWSWWTGFRLKGRTQHDIATWRCRKCGYLESYAAGG